MKRISASDRAGQSLDFLAAPARSRLVASARAGGILAQQFELEIHER